MVILGIDPGSITTGYGVVSKQGNHFKYIASGTIKMQSKQVLAERLQTINQSLLTIIEQYNPDCSAIEQVFVRINPKSALVLGHARGAAMLTLATCNLQIAEYAARYIKQVVVGTGGATKEQVNFMVTKLLAVKHKLQEDAADALAIAICHGINI